MTEDEKTCYAEGSYAARTGELYDSNPYPAYHEYHSDWAAGWIDGAQRVYTELKVTQRVLDNMVNERRELQAKLEQVEAEYDAFAIEMGY